MSEVTLTEDEVIAILRDHYRESGYDIEDISIYATSHMEGDLAVDITLKEME